MWDRIGRSPWRLFATCLLLACGGDLAPLEVEDAWVGAILPAQQVTAGYLTLNNTSPEPVRVTAVHSPAFDFVEIHEMATDEEGVMRMRRLNALDLAAGASVELRPGGLHLMMIRPRQAIAVGNDIPITLTTAGGKTLTFAVKVVKR